MGDPGTVTELTAHGIVTRLETAADKRERTMQAKRDAQEKAKREAARAWYVALLGELGLTLDDYRKLHGAPDNAELLDLINRWGTGDTHDRLAWLMRQRELIDLELRARYWRIGKRLRAKVLAGVERSR
jgi:hypothetical protein